jgi:hypothetical protein
MPEGLLPRRATAWLALCLTAIVLVDRIAGLDWMLPHSPEPDRHLTNQVGFLWNGGDPWSAPRQFYFYPALISRTVALTPPPKVPQDADIAHHLRAASEGVLRVRLLAALAGVLTIPLTYALARRFLQPWPALLAAGLLGTSYLFNLLSVQARPHAILACISLAAVLSNLALRAKAGLGAYFASGILAALAVGCLQNGAFVLPSLLCAHWLADKRRGFLKALVPAAIPIALVLLSLLSFYPFLASESGEADAPREFTDYTVRDGAIELGNQRLRLERFDGSGFARILDYLLWNDPVLLALCALGVAIGIPAMFLGWRRLPRERRADLAVVLAYAVPHYLVLGSYRHTWGRFLLPLLPFAAVLAAFAATSALAWIASHIASPRWRSALMALGALSLAAFPSFAWHRFGVLRRRPDTLEQAAAWLEANAQRGSDTVLVQRTLDLPLYSTPEALDASESDFPRSSYAPDSHRKWSFHQTRIDPSIGSEHGWKLAYTPFNPRRRKQLSTPEQVESTLSELAARYVVVEDSSRTAILPEESNLLAFARQRGHLVARFQPRTFTEPHYEWMDYQDARFAVLRTLRSSCFGPLIEIYELP